jgi:hypothetical protein
MNFWEQFILGFVISLLHALKVDPSRIPVFNTILLDIYDGIGELLNLPPRVAGSGMVTQATKQ